MIKENGQNPKINDSILGKMGEKKFPSLAM